MNRSFSIMIHYVIYASYVILDLIDENGQGEYSQNSVIPIIK